MPRLGNQDGELKNKKASVDAFSNVVIANSDYKSSNSRPRDTACVRL